MRARGACLVWLAACAFATACGSETKKPDASGGTDSEGGEDGGGKGGKASNGGSNSGAAGHAGDDAGGTSTGGKGAGGKAGSGSGGTSGLAGEGGGGGEGGEPPDPTKLPLKLSVSGDKDVHAISPLIYGANQPGVECDDAKARFSFCRTRSNAWSTYNWETNDSNAGAADCHENNDDLSAKTTPGAAVLDRIDVAEATSASSIVTVPMLGYVAADDDGGSASPACSGDISKSSDYLSTRLIPSRARKGSALSLTPDTSDGWVNQDELVAFLKDSRANANLLFALDNQPELWHLDHAKIQSEILTYDEIVDLSASYAEMIKDNWPGAPIIGFGGYGYLAAYNFQDADDFDVHGEFLPYFLQEMQDRSDAAGERLIDYVDLHWLPELYPNGERVIGESTTPEAIAARVQAPRSLWDASFVEDSWITGFNGRNPIQLLDWLQGSVDENYPGTQVAISEWSYGGGKHVSGAIAAADALGIFGQRGVGLAGVMSLADEAPYLVGAFQAYRNYDGAGAAFGDTSVAASSSDVSRASIYASIDESDPSRMVLVVINRSENEQPASLAIDHETSYSSLTPYCITDGHPEPVAGDAVEASEASAFELDLPAYSVCVLVPTE